MLGSAAPRYVIEAFSPADLLSTLRMLHRSLGEEVPPEVLMRLAAVQPEYCRVARDPMAGTVLGLIVGVRNAGHQGRVVVFGVDPAAQGLGVGRALLRSLQQAMAREDVYQVELEVRADNARAIEFYARQGFSVRQVQAGAYKDGTDAFVMGKPLR